MEINDRSKADWMNQLNWLEGSISYPAAYFESSDSSKIEFRDKNGCFPDFLGTQFCSTQPNSIQFKLV